MGDAGGLDAGEHALHVGGRSVSGAGLMADPPVRVKVAVNDEVAFATAAGRYDNVIIR